MAPAVPGFTTAPAKLEATVKAIAEHGAAFMGVNVMYLKGGTRDHFMEFIAREFPHMAEGFERLYAGAYAPPRYITAVRQMVDALQHRYDVKRRATKVPSDPVEDQQLEEATALEEQPTFEWE
jgi:hypothetical protein